MRSVRLLALPALLYPIALPVAATPCLDLVDRLESELSEAVLDQGQNDVALETKQGSVQVTTPGGGVPPQENWFGDPTASTAAAEALLVARRLADRGEEKRCLLQVRKVETLIVGRGHGAR